MIFHHRQKNITSIIPKLFINNSAIERVTEFNFLGTVIDESLTWNSHIQKISSKIARVIGVLNRLKRFLPCNILKLIYSALIQPHLNFGVLLWGINTKRILKLQKWAMRAITSSKYNAHADPLFKRLNILKIDDIYKLSALKFYYKYSKDQLPRSFHGFLDPITLNHTYQTRNRNVPLHPVPKSVLAKSTIRYTIPDLLASTPSCILDKIDTHSMQGFSLYAKKYFISQYRESCNINGCYICNK